MEGSSPNPKGNSSKQFGVNRGFIGSHAVVMPASRTMYQGGFPFCVAVVMVIINPCALVVGLERLLFWKLLNHIAPLMIEIIRDTCMYMYMHFWFFFQDLRLVLATCSY